ncbi:hypothetical protein [Pontibacter litorisediminis]|uniref:hypothetical protein n=1 Tax=Pontibacter litorisediminis TaxID=1846260 RepID=UPI0023EE0BD4|nr:hypothetical protein [Pontibacter litorisediminis]
MTFKEETINCVQELKYKNSNRVSPFRLVYTAFDYASNESHKKLLNKVFAKGEALAKAVNPAASNNATHPREKEQILNNAAAGLLAEYCWKKYLNQKAGRDIVDYTEFTAASAQIDLVVLSNEKRIEVRSSFPRIGITFSICHKEKEFDILGPYSNSVKPGEVQKDFYTRTLFHIPEGRSFLEVAKKDNFKVYLTGGATWDMMTDDAVSKEKTLRPHDAVAAAAYQESKFRVVPFSKALDTIEIFNLINQE